MSNDQRVVNVFVFLVALLIFLISCLFQLLFDKEPCQLCLITRYMFLSIAIIALFSSILRKTGILLVIAAFITLSFSFYHLGVENHWWLGPQSCTFELPTLDSISKSVEDSKRVYCDRVNWKILGLSSTLWSFLISAFLFWLTSVLYVLGRSSRRIMYGHR